MEFAPGDSILFHAGESWQRMFWLHGSGTPEFPIVVGKYGEGPRPILDGNGYQASLLIYNDECIAVQDLEFTNDASHLDEVGEVKKLEGFGGESNDWGSGKNVRFGIKVVADAQSIQRIQFANLYIHDVFRRLTWQPTNTRATPSRLKLNPISSRTPCTSRMKFHFLT